MSVTGPNGAQDRYGLALGTQSPAAAESYLEGVDRLLSLNAGTEESLYRAIEIDEGLALPHAALAILYRLLGEGVQARDAARRGLALAAGLSRRERQHLSIVDEYVGGDAARAYTLASEHLKEFPRDALILSQGNCTSTPPESRGRSVSRGSVNLPAQWNATIWVA